MHRGWELLLNHGFCIFALLFRIIMELDVIRQLPDTVANQIAAGEVIQRPASVIKELVENSIDAGASSVEIIIKDAGRTLIQVVDNGSGMTVTDARMAFERHATSKITAAADLFSLQTMGFRGEALPSIAAVAQIDMRTMRQGASSGTRLQISGNNVTEEACATTPGTSIMVKNLFYSVPARRKFLKRDPVELSYIMREFERLALVNPSVDFSIYHNDSLQHQLRRGSFKQRICDLFGKNLERQLIPVTTDTSIVRINGFIGLPESARKRNALQYLLVNGRNMVHPVFRKAIQECFEELLPHDRLPNFFIDFTVPPETIDVNIHPTKNEIKFENEFAIRQILMAAVRESLGKFSAVPGIDFDTEDAPDIPVFDSSAPASADIRMDRSYNPFNTESSSASSAMTMSGSDWEKLYDEFTRKREKAEQFNPFETYDSTLSGSSKDIVETGHEPELDLAIDAGTPDVQYIQALNRYIVTPCISGIMIIDRKRAHERVLYDRYMSLTSSGPIATQTLLFPEIVQLDTTQNAILEAVLPQMTAFGFDLAPLDNGSWNIAGVPALDGVGNGSELLVQILDSMEGDTSGEHEIENIRKRMAQSMARSMALKSGSQLTPEQAEALLADLFALETPNYTPDGRTVISIVNREDLASRFSRIQ